MPEKLPEPSAITVATPAGAVAAYVRMSTEHQRYSTTNQLSAIKEYAAERHFALVRVYSDEGVSGLTFERRAGLRSLLSDILSGRCDFRKVLVYDISRWGRFQDADEGAYYEYLCRLNGVEVIYCAETFQNERAPMTAIIKAVKRAMAAEYSRELSARILRAACNLTRHGYNVGGGCPYALKRLLVDPNGTIVRKVVTADRKFLRNHHIVLAPGPRREIEVVREIFRRYVKLDQSPRTIAVHLNEKGCRTRNGLPWGCAAVTYILRNEKYIGTQIYNQSTQALNSRRRMNDPSQWIRKANAFQAIVDYDTFQRAQAKRTSRLRGSPLTSEEMIDRTRAYIAKHGTVTKTAFCRANGMPGLTAVIRRFGKIARLYALIGYDHYSMSYNWNERKRLRELRHSILFECQDEVRRAGEEMKVVSSSSFVLGRNVLCSFNVIKLYNSKLAGEKWRLVLRKLRPSDFHLVARLNSDARTVRDYYLLPPSIARTMPGRLARRNGKVIDQYRAPSLPTVVKRLAVLARSNRLAAHRFVTR